jgi:hypothetical protein
MKEKTIGLLGFIFFLITGCEQKIHLTTNELIGKSAIEYVNLPGIDYLDSTRVYFYPNNEYRRTPGMYIQLEGHYEVRNDTLEIHYDCHKKCNDATCGVQQYVMKSDGKLYLTFMRDSDGIIEDLSKTPFDKVLEVQDH